MKQVGDEDVERLVAALREQATPHWMDGRLTDHESGYNSGLVKATEIVGEWWKGIGA